MKSSNKFALSSLCLATLAACGGGGGDSAPAQTVTALSAAPACVIGAVTYGPQLIVPDTCKAVGDLYNTAVANQTKAQADLTTATANLAAANKNLAAAQADAGANATQIGTLSAQLTKANADLASANAAVTASSDQIATLQTQIAASTADTSGLQAQLAAAQAAFAAAQAQAAADQATITKASADLAAAMNANATQAAQLTQAASDLAAANTQVASLQSQLAAAQGGSTTQIADLQSQFKMATDSLAATQAALTKAQADLAASGDAATILAAAKVAQDQAAVDSAKAATAAAQAAADKATAQAAAIQATTDKAAADQALVNAQAAQTAASSDAAKAAADKATTQALADQAAADKAVAQAAAATALADKNTATALAAQAAADKASAIAALAADAALQNATGLPICTLPVPSASVGTVCVLTFAQQKQVADDAAAAAAAFKFTGVYSASNAYVVAEVGGKVWMSDEANNEFLSGSILSSTGTAFTGSGFDISYLHTPVTLTGTYAQGSPNATVTADYGTANGFTKTTFPVTALTAPISLGAGTLNGDNGFSSDGGTVTMTVAADGTITGKEGNTCTFTGKFDAGTVNTYEKVTLTFATNVVDPVSGATTTHYCSNNKSGQTATGVIAVRDGSYLIMAELPGAFGKEGFGGYFTTPAPVVIASANRVKALSVKPQKATSAGLTFLNAVGSK